MKFIKKSKLVRVRNSINIGWPQITVTYKAIRRGGHVSMVVSGSFVNIEELDRGVSDIKKLLQGTKQATVKTKWVTVEVDKITALIYFIITISVFIAAIVILPNLRSYLRYLQP